MKKLIKNYNDHPNHHTMIIVRNMYHYPKIGLMSPMQQLFLKFQFFFLIAVLSDAKNELQQVYISCLRQ